MPPTLTMSEAPPPAEHSKLNLSDILAAIFKHKGAVLLCALAGLVAAAGVYVVYPPVYESQAKLLVRYVLDRSPVDPVDGQTTSSATTGFGKTTENIMNSEVEILTSWDLAVQVAEALGVKRLLPESGGAASIPQAAGTITSGLDVVARKGSDILFVSYKNTDPQLATLVLDELVNRYFVKHLEVHRSAAAFDFVARQSDQVRARLNETDDALKALKAKAGITSIADNTGTLSADVVKIEDQYLAAEAELAEQTARVKEIEGVIDASPGSSSPSPSPKNASGAESVTKPKASPDEVQRYQALASRLTALRQGELDLLSRYTQENEYVKLNRAEVKKIEGQKRELEKKFPDLMGVAPASGSSQAPQTDVASERTRLAGTKAKTAMLKGAVG